MEVVDIELASYGRRIGAWFLSLALMIATLGIGYLVWSAFIWRYGQTPALRLLGMQVHSVETEQRASWKRMMVRELLGSVGEVALGLITLLTSFAFFIGTKKRQSLRDIFAGTIVLSTEGH